MAFDFEKALRRWTSQHGDLVGLKNRRIRDASGVLELWENPVLSAAHAPLFWRYDLDRRRNPFLLERLGIAAVAGAGAVERGGKICLVARLVGKDGRGFFAMAESGNGVDNFQFWDYPTRLAEGGGPDARLSDIRLTPHEDGWLYGIFGSQDGSSGEAGHGIARTRDLVSWERLADLRSRVGASGAVALHPELVRGRYAFYAPTAGPAGGSAIAVALCENIEQAELGEASALDAPQLIAATPGPPPLRTTKGWLHIAHATRASASGPLPALRAFLCDLDEPTSVTAAPSGYLLSPDKAGDALTCAGAVLRATGEVFLYYTTPDGLLRVATSSVERLLDYIRHSPADWESARAAAAQRTALVERNLKLLARTKGKAYRGLRS